MSGCEGRGKWRCGATLPLLRHRGQSPGVSGLPGRTRAHPSPRTAAPAPPAPPVLTADQGPSFARAVWLIAAADVSCGNAVTLFDDGATTFDAMIAMIEQARHSVILETYILRSDGVGNRFLAALAAAAARRVHVRFLADWVGARGTSRSYYAALRRAGVEVRIFNPP